jgi:Txe/YoeB family toxin of Txe-Axe toxin-antitoxin module
MESTQDCRTEKERISDSLSDLRIKGVAFGEESIRKAFLELKSGRFEEKELADHIEKAIDRLKEDPLAGVKIPRKLWPVDYIRRFGIDNLRKYNLPDGWRLMYTLSGNQVEIVSIILEWLPHHEYERRFGYKQS